MIELKNISIQKGKNIVVSNFSYTFLPGRKYVILGKNGAGKSSLLDGLTGKSNYCEGEILWENTPLRNYSRKEMALRRAVLSQNTTVSFSIKVEELVEMGTYASTKSISGKSIKYMVSEALEKVRMLNFISRDFETLSGGEQKRVFLAKCLVQLQVSEELEGNKYIFLDEPTSSLDISEQLKFIELAKELVEINGFGVIAILHDLNLSSIFADELILMKDGQLCYGGPPGEVITSETLKEVLDIDSSIHLHPIYQCPQMTNIINF